MRKPLCGLAVLTLVGCASRVSPMLVEAREAYEEARTGPADEYAPDLVFDARTALEGYRQRWPGDERADEIATQLGDLAEASQNWDEAVKEYRTALAANPKPGLTTELHFRLGRALEQKGESASALASYQRAAESTDRDHAYRLSALARCAALYEAKKDFARALTAYRDIVKNARDQELVAAAADRASQLEAATKRR